MIVGQVVRLFGDKKYNFTEKNTYSPIILTPEVEKCENMDDNRK